MQAIRTLRGAAQSHSRVASPALDLVDESAISTNNPPNTTPTTTTTTTTTATATAHHPLSRIQTLTRLRRSSTQATPALQPTPPPTLIQDGNYLHTLGLKLNEATSRALAPVLGNGSESVKGRRPLPPGRGKALGALISSELTAARENPNLERAILRLLPRSLSVLVATLTSQLPPLLTSPHYVPASCTLPPTQWDPSTQHGLAFAGFCAELLQVFAAHSLGERSSDLGAIKATIENTVSRLTGPLFSALQAEILSCLDGATKPVTYKPSGRSHPALQQFQLIAPHAGRMLRRYTMNGCNTTESQLASVLIAVCWAGMLALVCRPTGIRLPSSPPFPPFVSLPGSKTGRTPPSTPKNPLRLLKDPTGSSPNAFSLVSLPAVLTSSRPPSPPPAEGSPLVLDFKVFLEVMERDFPRPHAKEGLAGEAVEEGLGRARALGEWVVRGFTNNEPSPPSLKDFFSTRLNVSREEEEDDDDDELPFLLALELLLRHRLGVESGAAAYLGMDEGAYKKRCLSGFGRADEWACVVGRAVREGLKRLNGGGVGEDEKRVVREWIMARVEV